MAKRSQQGSAGTQMMILGLVFASSMVFLIGLFIGAGTDPGPKTPNANSVRSAPDRDDGPFPSLVAAVTVSGTLVAIDTEDGSRRDLVTAESPSGAPTALGFGRITMPDSGRIAYYERRAENGSSVWRVGTGGGPAQRVTQGRDPAVSPDGRFLATIVDSALVITDLSSDTSVGIRQPTNTTLHLPAWAPTSKALVVEAHNGNQVRLFTTTLTGEQMRPGPFTPLAASPTPDAIAPLRSPAWRASDSAIVALGTRGGAPYGVVVDTETGVRTPFPLEGPARSADYDSSGLYFGYVLEQGVARWQGRGSTGRIADDIVDFVW